jgi:hypothetical protein
MDQHLTRQAGGGISARYGTGYASGTAPSPDAVPEAARNRWLPTWLLKSLTPPYPGGAYLNWEQDQ